MNPKEITISPDISAAETVEHFITVVEGRASAKSEALRNLIRGEDILNAIIFCNRKKDVDSLERSLRKDNFSTATLHGDMSQPARLETLEKFRGGSIQLLVASDVAARGLDLPKVSHVFNFDVPMHAEDYVHRIGRTGRAGRSGRAFTLATPEDSKYLAAVERFIGKTITRFEIEGVKEGTLEESDERRGGRRGRRSPPSRGKAKPSGKKSASSTEETPAPAPEQKSEQKQDTPQPQEAASDRPKRRTRKPRERAAESKAESKPKAAQNESREKADVIVGMGDHMPAFMQRSPGKK